MSGFEVLGGISGLITIVDACTTIYNNARKDLKLPKTFPDIARRLILLSSTLATCRTDLELRRDSISAEVWTALQEIINGCEQKAQGLRATIEKLVINEDDGWKKRSSKVLRRSGKGQKVKDLMDLLVADVQLIVNHQAVQAKWRGRDEPDQHLQILPSSTAAQPLARQHFTEWCNTQNDMFKKMHQQNLENVTGIQNFNLGSRQDVDTWFTRPLGFCLDQAPYIDSRLFVGREAQIDAIHQVLQPTIKSVEQRRAVLGGMGGVGKTQLAIAYARCHGDFYDSVLWLNGTCEADLRANLKSLAIRIFGFEGCKPLDDRQIVECMKQWLSDSKNKRWLLVLDNYDDPKAYKVQDFIPFTSHGAIIVTTRLPDHVGGHKILVRPLENINDSLLILQTRSQRNDVSNDLYARQLAKRLAGHPLALVTAAAYLRKSTWSFDDYLRAYDKQWNVNPRYPVELDEYQNRTFATTWDLSYSHLEAESPEAAKLLKLLAYFDPQAIWYDLFHAGQSDYLPHCLKAVVETQTEFEGVMQVLIDYCFVEVQVTGKTYSVHNCVHDWIFGCLNESIDENCYRYALVCVAESTQPYRFFLDGMYNVKLAPLALHAVRLTHTRFANMKTDNLYELLTSMLVSCLLLLGQCHHQAAKILLNQTMSLIELELDCDEHLQTFVIDLLANAHMHLGEFTEAEKAWERVVRENEKRYGLFHKQTLDSYSKLSLVYISQGKYEQAEQICTRALADKELMFGSTHVDTLTTAGVLGTIYAQQGKLVKAEMMCSRSLNGLVEAVGWEYVGAIQTVCTLGSLYVRQDRLSEAESIYLRVLTKTDGIVGPKVTAPVNAALAKVYYKQGKLDQAEQLYLQVLDIFCDVLGPEHSGTLEVVRALGTVYRLRESYQDAEKMLVRALAGFDKMSTLKDYEIHDVIAELGHMYIDRGKLDEAEKLFDRLLRSHQNPLFGGHIENLDIVDSLGIVYLRQGKLAEAEDLYTRALVVCAQSSEEPPAILFYLEVGLGDVYLAQDKLLAAERLYTRALAMYGAKPVIKIHRILCVLCNLVRINVKLGNLQELEQSYLRMVFVNMGTKHYKTLFPCISDYAKNIYQQICTNVNTPQLSHASLRQLLVHCCIWAQVIESIVYWVAMAFVKLEDDANAQIGFEYSQKYWNSPTDGAENVQCYVCRQGISTDSGFHICRRCEDVNVCDECMSQHKNHAFEIRDCRDHDYFNVVPSSESSESLNRDDSQSQIYLWLEKVKTQFTVS